MNQPNNHEETRSVEERLADIEKFVRDANTLVGDIVKNEQELLKLSRHHRFNLREVSGVVGSTQLDIGDFRERFDTIERTMATKEDTGRIETRIEQMDVEQKKRIDTVESLLVKILDRLPQPEGE